MLFVLADFKSRRDSSRSRAHYLEIMSNDLKVYYNYNDFLMEKLMNIFNHEELKEFLESSEVQRPIAIRTNTLKTRRRDLAQALINIGVNVDPIGKWTKAIVGNLHRLGVNNIGRLFPDITFVNTYGIYFQVFVITYDCLRV